MSWDRPGRAAGSNSRGTGSILEDSRSAETESWSTSAKTVPISRHTPWGRRESSSCRYGIYVGITRMCTPNPNAPRKQAAMLRWSYGRCKALLLREEVEKRNDHPMPPEGRLEEPPTRNDSQHPTISPPLMHTSSVKHNSLRGRDDMTRYEMT